MRRSLKCLQKRDRVLEAIRHEGPDRAPSGGMVSSGLVMLLAVLLLGIVVGRGADTKPAGPKDDARQAFNLAKLKPFWLSNTMEGESVLFIKGDGVARPKASLLFPPTKILSVGSASGKAAYVEGQDYIWQRGSNEITLPAGSRIPFRTPQDLRRPAGSQAYRLTRRDGNGEIFLGAPHEYHDMQTVVAYEHRPVRGKVLFHRMRATGCRAPWQS